jgi:tripeptidyl-peptidase-1
MSPADTNPEEVWNEDLTLGFFLSGGGGFSNRFPTANYQMPAVSKYLETLREKNPALLAHFNHSGVRSPR